MQHAGIRRAMIVSTAFLFKDSIVPPTYLFGRLFFPGMVIDATAMERVFAESGLDWTIVRPSTYGQAICRKVSCSDRPGRQREGLMGRHYAAGYVPTIR
jgi:hypothetical protein